MCPFGCSSLWRGHRLNRQPQCNKTDALGKVSVSAVGNAQEISTQTWASAKLSEMKRKVVELSSRMSPFSSRVRLTSGCLCDCRGDWRKLIVL